MDLTRRPFSRVCVCVPEGVVPRALRGATEEGAIGAAVAVWRVFHVPCAGLAKEPKGLWRCPWHACHTCDKRKSDSGGMLFQCAPAK
eukprot:1189805-Prorocentrum_minimum.AAC.2